MREVDDLRRRLEAAERVCVLFGATASTGETERDKALGQAWSEWNQRYRGDAPTVNDRETEILARRRDQIRDATVGRIREKYTDG